MRLAEPRDELTITTILHDAFIEYKKLYTVKAFYSTILGITKIRERIDSGTMWVALCDGVIAGTISLIPDRKGLYIRSVAVAPTARRKGLGKTLMKHAEQEATGKGLEYLELTTTTFLFEAIKLYQSFGFEECGYEDLYGTPLIKMKKYLIPAIVSLNAASCEN
jgi:ribosomal protein S18 acetylase RimI-like enzyme